MIDVGEETGKLPDMLLKIADVYDDEVDNSVAALTRCLSNHDRISGADCRHDRARSLYALISIITGLQQQT